MKHNRPDWLLLGLLSLAGFQAFAQTQPYEPINRTIEILKADGKSIVRLSEGSGPGVAWLKGVDFSEGTLEFDAKGRDLLQKSFIGIAFHGISDTSYESVYFRPFNFQAADPLRKVHAVQYVFVPDFDFQKLRETRKDEFEAAILPSTVQPTDWFHVRIEVKDGRIKAFANQSPTPSLDVATLNGSGKSGKIGFWVGNNSNGEFANLKITNR